MLVARTIALPIGRLVVNSENVAVTELEVFRDCVLVVRTATANGRLGRDSVNVSSENFRSTEW